MQKLPKFAVTLLALACTLGQAWADEQAPVPFSELAVKCAPTVHPQTLKSLIGNESTYNPYAIGVVDGRLERQPKSLREAVATAEQGGNDVSHSIQRMQELAENSRKINDIIQVIDSIAFQTNILALNAAIQASMAGEAGRGFAVVADEVQRLAERSASATKQIESLVKTIQTDTNEAVISMEQTTSEVVRGANLAKDAGIALDEIQTVSGDLAKLIASISDAAKLQSASASHIATTMNVVQEITSQTTTATFDTARSVSELANMAESLRESVTDFKLPE